MHYSRPWRGKETFQDNPIGLSHEVAAELAAELDRHQASLFVLFHQYQKHHWLVEGPQFRDLHLFFQEAYEEVHKTVDQLAERMTALGGIPTSGPAAFSSVAYLEQEPEGMFHIRTMLEHDREAERQIALRLRDTIHQATDLGDYGTEFLLKSALLRVEERAHHLDHYLGEDSLEIGRTGETGAEQYATAQA